MATRDLPILGAGYGPDESGDVSVNKIRSELTLANADGEAFVFILPAAATISVDTGIKGSFKVPIDYVGTPLLVISGILDGAPASLVIAFGVQFRPLADDEAYDVAYNAQNIASASSVGQADEDIYEEIITISDTFVAGDEVDYFLFIDDSVHTYTGKFLGRSLMFRYNNVS